MQSILPKYSQLIIGITGPDILYTGLEVVSDLESMFVVVFVNGKILFQNKDKTGKQPKQMGNQKEQFYEIRLSKNKETEAPSLTRPSTLLFASLNM